MRRAPLLVLTALAAAACKSDPDSVVIVAVDADLNVPTLNQLKVTMSNGGRSEVHSYPVAASPTAITFPASFSVTLPRSRTGNLDVAVAGLDANSTPAANGSARTVIVVGGRQDVGVRLVLGPSSCGNGHVDPGEECDDGNQASGDSCDFRCTSESGPAVPDAGSDAPDASDAGGLDVLPLPAPEPGPEPPFVVEPQVGPERGAEPQAGPEPGAEPQAGPEPQPGPERGAEPQAGPEPEPEPQAGPEPGPEPGPEAPDAGPGGTFACPSINVINTSSTGGGRTPTFNTTGPYCFVTCDDISGWGCSNFSGRLVMINGQVITSCSSTSSPLPAKSADGYYLFQISAGAQDYASIFWWGTAHTCTPPDGGYVPY